MNKHFGKRIILLNLSIITTVIILAFVSIFGISYLQYRNDTNRQLEVIMRQPMSGYRPVTVSEAVLSAIDPNYRVSFSLLINNNRLESINTQLDYDLETYAYAYQKTGQQSKGSFWMHEKRWAFSRYTQTTTSQKIERVAFLDVTQSYQSLISLAIALGSVGVVVFIVFLYIGYRFTKRALMPIEASYEKQQQFIADASHEFKTPLAIIHATVEAIETSPEATIASQQLWLDTIKNETQRANRLILQLLTLTQVNDAVAPVSFSLSETVNTCLQSMAPSLALQSIKIETNIAEGVHITAPKDSCTQVLFILIDNAIKYALDASTITCTLTQDGTFTITNACDPLDEHAVSHLFDRFYRPDVSRTQTTGGHGLGLSIAHDLIQSMNGSIDVKYHMQMITFKVSFEA